MGLPGDVRRRRGHAAPPARDQGADRKAAPLPRSPHFEHNFLAGRTFTDWEDLNAKARAWCERIAGKFRKRLRASPIELLRAERPQLRPLPPYVPDVYTMESRVVDLEGLVHLYGNRYSAPAALLGRTLEVRAYKDRVVLFDGKRQAAEHRRAEDGADLRISNPEHRGPRRKPGEPPRVLPEQKILEAASVEIAQLTEMVRARHGVRAVRRLYRIHLDYPAEALQKAAATALAFGLRRGTPRPPSPALPHHHRRRPLAPHPQERRLRAVVSDRRPPPRLGAVVLPALSPREAEIIIDLIGQLQAALWDAYGEAILALPTDQDQSDDGDLHPAAGA